MAVTRTCHIGVGGVDSKMDSNMLNATQKLKPRLNFDAFLKAVLKKPSEIKPLHGDNSLEGTYHFEFDLDSGVVSITTAEGVVKKVKTRGKYQSSIFQEIVNVLMLDLGIPAKKIRQQVRK